MPDIHSGYGFAVGNVAAFDMDDPASIVSPGGVGFDINCGVRLIRTGMPNAQVSCHTTLHEGSSIYNHNMSNSSIVLPAGK